MVKNQAFHCDFIQLRLSDFDLIRFILKNGLKSMTDMLFTHNLISP